MVTLSIEQQVSFVHGYNSATS